MPAVEIITREDLEAFGEKLLSQIRAIVGQTEGPKKLLKSYQVKNLLKISPGTLQNLRINGTLPFTRIGGIIYYRYEDIVKIFEGDKKGKK